MSQCPNVPNSQRLLKCEIDAIFFPSQLRNFVVFWGMKKIVGLVLFISILGWMGCGADPCASRDCQNGGICIDGRCDCPEGFVGGDCELSVDPCVTKNCNPNQTQRCASNGSSALCVCEDGFEGDLCDAQWTDKYLNRYEVVEICNGKTNQFFSDVEFGPRFKQVTFTNFHNERSSTSGAKVVVNLVQSEVFDLFEQFMPFGVVTGAGSFSSTNMTIGLNYQIIETDGDTLACSATYQ